MPVRNIILFNCFISSYFPAILLADGASDATPEEVAAQRARLKEAIRKLEESREERERVNNKHSEEQDNDDPNQENTVKELEGWDETIDLCLRIMEEVVNWLAN